MGYLRLANYKYPHNFSKLVLAALPLEAPTNPTRRQSVTNHLPQPLPPHHHRQVVRFVVCNWSFLLPPYRAILFPQHTT